MNITAGLAPVVPGAAAALASTVGLQTPGANIQMLMPCWVLLSSQLICALFGPQLSRCLLSIGSRCPHELPWLSGLQAASLVQQVSPAVCSEPDGEGQTGRHVPLLLLGRMVHSLSTVLPAGMKHADPHRALWPRVLRSGCYFQLSLCCYFHRPVTVTLAGEKNKVMWKQRANCTRTLLP